jgi:hypothetical protein
LAIFIAVVAVLASSCGFGPADPSAQYFPSSRLEAKPLPQVVSNVDQSVSLTAILRGQLAMPNAKLTPGEVAITDLAAVCLQGKKIKGTYSTRNPAISLSEQQAVFAEYGIAPAQQHKYALDFLVPQLLGGANSVLNIWPIKSVVAFHEKERLGVLMHIVVCHGDMPLADAQKQIATDWERLYVRYGAF